MICFLNSPNNEADLQQVLALALVWLQGHGGEFRCDRGYLFGSVTQPGSFTTYSDVDVAVETLKGGCLWGFSTPCAAFAILSAMPTAATSRVANDKLI